MRNSFLFESFSGKNFQGNPYYIYKAAFQSSQCKHSQFYISVKEPDLWKNTMRSRGLSDERTHFIKTGSDEYHLICEKVKYIVLNVSLGMDYIKRPGQIILNTWHGTPLKTLGRRVFKDPFSVCSAQRSMLLSDYLIAPNELLKSVYLYDHMIHDIMPGKLVMTGYPRNSIFFDAKSRNAVRRQLEVDKKKTILWMPTWREDGTEDQMEMLIEIDRLAGKLGENYVIYFKLHPSVSKEIPSLNNLKQVPSTYEVYEFLNAMDVLITDYSSVYFDYASSDGQIILFQYDTDAYNVGRGIYPEVKDKTPYLTVSTIEELEQAIRFPKQVNASDFIKEFCPFDSIDAAQYCLNMMIEDKAESSTISVDLYVINFIVTNEKLLKWKEQINNPRARFVFMPGNRFDNIRFKNVDCFEKIDYFVYFKNSNLTIRQRMMPSTELIIAEQHRLWGLIDIANVYAKPGFLPPALSRNRRKWPKELR